MTPLASSFFRGIYNFLDIRDIARLRRSCSLLRDYIDERFQISTLCFEAGWGQPTRMANVVEWVLDLCLSSNKQVTHLVIRPDSVPPLVLNALAPCAASIRYLKGAGYSPNGWLAVCRKLETLHWAEQAPPVVSLHPPSLKLASMDIAAWTALGKEGGLTGVPPGSQTRIIQRSAFSPDIVQWTREAADLKGTYCSALRKARLNDDIRHSPAAHPPLTPPSTLLDVLKARDAAQAGPEDSHCIRWTKFSRSLLFLDEVDDLRCNKSMDCDEESTDSMYTLLEEEQYHAWEDEISHPRMPVRLGHLTL